MMTDITDEVARKALHTYVHHTGGPVDGMRSAINGATSHLTDDAYQRGWSEGRQIGYELGKAEIAHPIEHAMWRDALALAVGRMGDRGHANELLVVARWFYAQMKTGPADG
jgi:hypothetical protein